MFFPSDISAPASCLDAIIYSRFLCRRPHWEVMYFTIFHAWDFAVWEQKWTLADTDWYRAKRSAVACRENCAARRRTGGLRSFFFKEEAKFSECAMGSGPETNPVIFLFLETFFNFEQKCICWIKPYFLGKNLKFWATVYKTVRCLLSDRCPVCLSVGLSCPVLSVCNVGVLWPNGCMDHDETWHGARPRPRQHCVRLGPSCPSFKKGGIAPNFWAMSIVAKRQDGLRCHLVQR